MSSGHRAAGVIESIGSDVRRVAVDDMVILNWRAVSGQSRARKRGRPLVRRFDTFNASVPMAHSNGAVTHPVAGCRLNALAPHRTKTIVTVSTTLVARDSLSQEVTQHMRPRA